jgi:hypothetical protein
MKNIETDRTTQTTMNIIETDRTTLSSKEAKSISGTRLNVVRTIPMLLIEVYVVQTILCCS